jgi:hypothetical protein
MNQHHIPTGGISLLTNYARERKLTADDALDRHKATQRPLNMLRQLRLPREMFTAGGASRLALLSQP